MVERRLAKYFVVEDAMSGELSFVQIKSMERTSEEARDSFRLRRSSDSH